MGKKCGQYTTDYKRTNVFSNADLTKARKPIETKVNTFLFMYINSRDVIICYLEVQKTRSVFPIPLEFKISKFACMYTTLGKGQEMSLTFNTHISSYTQLDVCSY